jgi:Recombinase
VTELESTLFAGRNEKYIGRWMWNRTETRHDPRTGRLRKFPKPEAEWHVVEDDGLRIVSQDVWNRGVARWKQIERTWPRRPGKRGFEGRQRSYVETHPPHLLSGGLRCGVCGGAIAQVSGKGAGYYLWLSQRNEACLREPPPGFSPSHRAEDSREPTPQMFDASRNPTNP